MVSGPLIGLSQQGCWRDQRGTTLLFRTKPVIPEAKICAAGPMGRYKEQEKQREDAEKGSGWLLVEKVSGKRPEDRKP